jgi:hypothetical protein
MEGEIFLLCLGGSFISDERMLEASAKFFNRDRVQGLPIYKYDFTGDSVNPQSITAAENHTCFWSLDRQQDTAGLNKPFRPDLILECSAHSKED